MTNNDEEYHDDEEEEDENDDDDDGDDDDDDDDDRLDRTTKDMAVRPALLSFPALSRVALFPSKTAPRPPNGFTHERKRAPFHHLPCQLGVVTGMFGSPHGLALLGGAGCLRQFGGTNLVHEEPCLNSCVEPPKWRVTRVGHSQMTRMMMMMLMMLIMLIMLIMLMMMMLMMLMRRMMGMMRRREKVTPLKKYNNPN